MKLVPVNKKKETPSIKLKPIKKLDTTTKKKLSLVSGKSKVNEDVNWKLCQPYTGAYTGNFPLKPKYKSYNIVTNKIALIDLAYKMSQVPEFAFDTETNTLRVYGPNKDFSLVGISVSWGDHFNYYIPVGHLREEDFNKQLPLDTVVKHLKPCFEREDVRIIGSNLKFDFHVLNRVGIQYKTKDTFDLVHASWLCDENSPNGLKENSELRMMVPQEHFAEVTKKVPNSVRKEFGYKANSKVPFSLVLIEDGAPYALDDAYLTYCNYLGFQKELEDEGMDAIFYKVFVPFSHALYKMEERGVSVDFKRLEKMKEEMDSDLDELQYKIYEKTGIEFDIGSAQQKAEILFGYRKPDTLYKDTSKIPKKFLKAYADRDEVKLEKMGAYITRSGYLCARANVNEHLIERAFNFATVGSTKKGAPSVDADTLWKLSNKTYKDKRKQVGVEMCKLLLEYAKLSKLRSAFVEGIYKNLYDDNKIHPEFNQTGTDSGRISCKNINLQQLPKAEDSDKYRIRELFIGSLVKDGSKKRNKIIAVDYKNLEMMCLTHFSLDENLLRMFKENEDAHGSTAVNMFNLDCLSTEVKKKYPHLRQAAKIINFMLMYGGGAKALYEALKDDHDNPIDLGSKEYTEMYHVKNGIQVAQIYIDKYFSSYKGVDSYIKKQKKFAHRNGYVNSILGRKRRLPDINSLDTFTSSYCERLSVNSAIQGTAGDITSSAQIRIDKCKELEELKCFMIIQVHDEIVFECPEENVEKAIPIIQFLMEHPFGDKKKLNLDLVADADFGSSYQEAK